MMASNTPDEPRPARPFRTAMIVAGLAFLVGLALMAWALTQWEPMKRFVAGNEPAPVVTATVNRPITAAPPAGMMAADAPPVAATIGQTSAIDARIADLEGRMARPPSRCPGGCRWRLWLSWPCSRRPRCGGRCVRTACTHVLRGSGIARAAPHA